MNRRKAFTIVELLTSIVIIAILLGILLPSIAMVRRTAKETAQKAQFATMDMAIDAFKQDYGDYPPSICPVLSTSPPPLVWNYGGAQKLAEALVGWDLMGFHPKSAWLADGTDGAGNPVYAAAEPNLKERRGPYLEVATARAFRVGDIPAQNKPGLFTNTGLVAPDTFVLCDVFGVRKITDSSGKTVTAGAPILYYKANTASKNITDASLQNRIYDYQHDKPIVDLGKLTATGAAGNNHPLGYSEAGDYPVFYSYKYSSLSLETFCGIRTGYGIVDPKVTTYPWPYRPDSYILISAGMDGYYGTADDIHNY